MDRTIVCRDYNGKEYSFSEKEYINHESVYGAIVEKGSLLLVEHPTSKRWEFPGGGIEKGENTFAALSREIEEETGLTISGEITLIKRFVEYYYDIGACEPWRSARSFYAISQYSGELRSNGNDDDVSRAQFVNQENLNTINLTEAVKEAANLVLV